MWLVEVESLRWRRFDWGGRSLPVGVVERPNPESPAGLLQLSASFNPTLPLRQDYVLQLVRGHCRITPYVFPKFLRRHGLIFAQSKLRALLAFKNGELSTQLPNP